MKGIAVVIDAQVVSEQSDLNGSHTRKVKYYQEPSFIEAVKNEFNVQEVKVTSATLSWKGLWSPKSANDLKSFGLVRAPDIKIISTRVLIGDINAFCMFNALTSVNYRAGVG